MGKKAKHKFSKVKRIEVKDSQIQELLNRVEDRALLDGDYEIIKGMAETIRCMSQSLDDSAASIKRLVRYLLGAPTETAKNILPKDDSKNGDSPPEGAKPKESRKGHGRLGAESYTGGRLVKVAHPSLAPGDPFRHVRRERSTNWPCPRSWSTSSAQPRFRPPFSSSAACAATCAGRSLRLQLPKRPREPSTMTVRRPWSPS